MATSEQKFTLRERKYAKTKIALMNAFIERLNHTRFHDISIKEICESVEVSEGTFFNYFPQKIDVVFYYKQILVLKLIWKIQQSRQLKGPWELIESTFDFLANDMQQPYLFYELISIFTAAKQKHKEVALTIPEKKYAYPDLKGIEKVSVVSLEETFSTLISEAVKKGAIKKDVKQEEVLLALLGILIGIPLAIDLRHFDRLKIYYKAQLSLLWQAVGAA